MLKKFLGDKYTRANNIAKSVRSLQRVPEKERPRIVKKAVLNVYVIGSIIILISLWLYFFGNEIMAIPIGNNLEGETFRSRRANLYLHLLVPVFIPVIFIFGIPLLIRNYIIKRIVDKEFPEEGECRLCILGHNSLLELSKAAKNCILFLGEVSYKYSMRQ